MNSQIETLLDLAEDRYLQPDELDVLSQYVSSLPARLEAYRQLRDHELAIVQQVADQLQAQFPNERIELLELSLKNALLTLRYCAMAMLLNDEAFARNRLLDWLNPVAKAYHTEVIDQQLYRLLDRQLDQALNPVHVSLLKPHLQEVRSLFTESEQPSLLNLSTL